jgi:hypothetical protein
MAINPDASYVWYAAFWPSLSDYTLDGWNKWWRSIDQYDPHITSIDESEGKTPFYIGEWDVALQTLLHPTPQPGDNIQFRGVTVYGVIDQHDALLVDNTPDLDFADGEDVRIPDSEMMYLLDEVFNPWDLQKVNNKETERWVQKETADGIQNIWFLEYSNMYPDTMYDAWGYVGESEFYWSDWDAYCSFAERVLVDGVLMERDVDYTLGVSVGDVYVWFVETPEEDAEIKILFSTYGMMGWATWEWAVVGRDAAAVDSAGAANVATYLDWMLYEPVKMSALDMQDVLWGPTVPYVMSEMRPGEGTVQVRPDPSALQPSSAVYRDDDFGPNIGRSAFRDDWCMHILEDEWYNGIPISSSNIVTIGSAWANLASEYFNEFTDAYLDVGTGESMYPGRIVALTCWNKNTYMPTWDVDGNQLTGYGVITTYKDLNGTVGLSVYGYTGQDTYWTTWAMMHKYQLWIAQLDIPVGVTTLVIEFDYTLHPTDYCFASVIEALGTISECDVWAWELDIDGGDLDISQAHDQMPETYEEFVEDKLPTIHPDP